jgi:hypothetical protein
MNERFELRQVDGAPADQRVIGIRGDESTVVAGVPYGTDEEKRRAQLLVASPELLDACKFALDRISNPALADILIVAVVNAEVPE